MQVSVHALQLTLCAATSTANVSDARLCVLSSTSAHPTSIDLLTIAAAAAVSTFEHENAATLMLLLDS
jgi:hypothetical protein